jgi:hypothetical protein
MDTLETEGSGSFLEILGCIARDFAAVEDLVELYIEYYVGDPEVGKLFTKSMNFKTKCDRLRDMVKLKTKDDVLKNNFLDWIKECEDCATRRNRWLHTNYVLGDSGSIQSVNRKYKKTFSSDEVIFEDVNFDEMVHDADTILKIRDKGFKDINLKKFQ